MDYQFIADLLQRIQDNRAECHRTWRAGDKEREAELERNFNAIKQELARYGLALGQDDTWDMAWCIRLKESP